MADLQLGDEAHIVQPDHYFAHIVNGTIVAISDTHVLLQERKLGTLIGVDRRRQTVLPGFVFIPVGESLMDLVCREMKKCPEWEEARHG